MQEFLLKIWHIQAVESCTYPTALRQKKFIHHFLDKAPHQKVTIPEYIEFLGITKELFDHAVTAWYGRRV